MRTQLKSLRYNGDFQIVFSYDDGLTAELNFENHFQNTSGPVAEPLRDEQLFGQAYIDHGALTWPNGYDVCPDILRYWCEQGRVCSREETDAHFERALLPVESGT